MLFDSVQSVFAAEKILLSAGAPHKLIPTPRHISVGCGFCLRFDWQMKETIERLLEDGGLPSKKTQLLEMKEPKSRSC